MVQMKHFVNVFITNLNASDLENVSMLHIFVTMLRIVLMQVMRCIAVSSYSTRQWIFPYVKFFYINNFQVECLIIDFS